MVRVEQWQPLAEESGVHIAVTAPDMAPVLAVPGAAEQIIDNLIDNALAVSPADTTIGVTVTPASDTVDLHVLDEGPGMSSQDCDEPSTGSGADAPTPLAVGWAWPSSLSSPARSGSSRRVDTTHVGQHRYRRTRCAHPVRLAAVPVMTQRDSALRSSSAPSRTPARCAISSPAISRNRLAACGFPA